MIDAPPPDAPPVALTLNFTYTLDDYRRFYLIRNRKLPAIKQWLVIRAITISFGIAFIALAITMLTRQPAGILFGIIGIAIWLVCLPRYRDLILNRKVDNYYQSGHLASQLGDIQLVFYENYLIMDHLNLGIKASGPVTQPYRAWVDGDAIWIAVSQAGIPMSADAPMPIPHNAFENDQKRDAFIAALNGLQR
jgi:hypothetical protein